MDLEKIIELVQENQKMLAALSSSQSELEGAVYKKIEGVESDIRKNSEEIDNLGRRVTKIESKYV